MYKVSIDNINCACPEGYYEHGDGFCYLTCPEGEFGDFNNYHGLHDGSYRGICLTCEQNGGFRNPFDTQDTCCFYD
jgi:hypothetical protein